MTGRTRPALLRAWRMWCRLMMDLSPARESPGFRWLLLGAVGVNLCRQALMVLVPLHVYLLTGSAALVGVVGVVQAVPLISGSLFGGLLADAFDRRRVLVVTQVTALLVCLGFAATAAIGSVPVILSLAFVNGLLQGIESPARAALIPGLVRPQELAAAYTINNTLVRGASIIGPALTGGVVVQAGLTAAYLTSATMLGMGTLATLAMRLPRVPRLATRLDWRSAAEGLRFIRHRPLLRQCLLVDFFAMTLSMPRAAFPILGIEVYDGDAATVGLLHAALGAGALLGMATSGWMTRVERPGAAVLVSVLAWSAAITLLGVVPDPTLAYVLLATAGAADAFSGVLRMSIVQLETPDEVRGRVTAITTATFQSGPLIADARAGGVAELVGPQFSVISGGLAGGVACAVLLLSGTRALVRYRPH